MLQDFIICKPAEVGFCPTIQVTNEEVKQYWPQYWWWYNDSLEADTVLLNTTVGA